MRVGVTEIGLGSGTQSGGDVPPNTASYTVFWPIYLSSLGRKSQFLIQPVKQHKQLRKYAKIPNKNIFEKRNN